jgi:hypothetical protein
VLTGGAVSTVTRVSTGRRHRWGDEGVVEAAKEVVWEELLCGTELAVGSAELGNNRRRLPPVGFSQRKTTVG